MIDLSLRSTQAEIMDDFDCNGEVVHQTLRELHAINTYLGGNQISIHALNQLTKKHPKDNYTLADLGCGGGDMMLLMNKWAKRKSIELFLTGIDANPHIVDYAENHCGRQGNIEFLTQDIFDEPFAKQKFDIIHGSLFFHHFNTDELIKLFKQLKKQTRIGIIINDLHRHVVSYYFTKWLITTWSKSDMVKFDSVVSVARSFKKKELVQVLNAAGIEKYSMSWRWAFRWEVIIYV